MKDRIMFKATGVVALILMGVSVLLANPTPPENPWEYLGAKKISRTNDKDVLYLDNFGEWYSAIELRSNKDLVDLQRLVVHYEDGSKHDVSLSQDYAGEHHPVINLDGNNKAVSRIAIYGSKTVSYTHLTLPTICSV